MGNNDLRETHLALHGYNYMIQTWCKAPILKHRRSLIRIPLIHMSCWYSDKPKTATTIYHPPNMADHGIVDPCPTLPEAWNSMEFRIHHSPSSNQTWQVGKSSGKIPQIQISFDDFPPTSLVKSSASPSPVTFCLDVLGNCLEHVFSTPRNAKLLSKDALRICIKKLHVT